MENMEGSEGTPTKISDSGYSVSCGNSQSQRSGSSKSRHSGSNSSGSSGYGGNASSTLTNSNESPSQPLSKHKELKKKKNKGPTASTSSNTTESSNDRDDGSRNTSTTQEHTATEDDNVIISSLFILPSTTQQHADDFNKDCLTPRSVHSIHEIQNNKNGEDEKLESTAINVSTTKTGDAVSHATRSSKFSDDEFLSYNPSKLTNDSYYMIKDKLPVICNTQISNAGFSCVISMSDGIILYANSSVNQSLGFPKDMFLGRSFIEFVHPKDRNTFASYITSGVAFPLTQSPAYNKAGNEVHSTLFCRVKRYKGLRSSSGNSTYAVRERDINYLPFRLDFSFKDISEIEISGMFLIINAVPIESPYSDSKDLIERFATRHTSSGIISHVNPEAVGFLGYLPQDIIGRCIFDFYHPEDMMYLKEVYENITKRGNTYKSKTYRFRTQNGDYLTIESDWSSFINPWSRKLEFVVGQHHLIYGPTNTDVFQRIKMRTKFPEDVLKQSRKIQDDILKILNALMMKQNEREKQSITKKCKNLAIFMGSDVGSKSIEELHIEIPTEKTLSERDSVMLGEISPHHDYYDDKSSTGTPPSYNQLNYSENLQRFFESYPCTSEKCKSPESNSTGFSENCTSSSEYFIPKTNRKFVFPDGKPSLKTIESSGETRNEGCYSGSTYQSQYAKKLPKKTKVNQMLEENDYIPIYLTQDLLTKHNSLMEKMLVKKHKVARSVSKAEEKEKYKKRNKNEKNNFKKTSLRRNTFKAYLGTSKKHGAKRPNCATCDNVTDSYKVKERHVIQPKWRSNNSCQTPFETPVVQRRKKKSNKPKVADKKIKSIAKKHFASRTSANNDRKKNKCTTATTASSPCPPFSMPGTSIAHPIVHPVPTYKNAVGAYSTMYLIPTQHRPTLPEAPTMTKPVGYPFQYLMYPQAMFNSQPLMYPHLASTFPSVVLPNSNPTPIVNPTNAQPLVLPTVNYKQGCQNPPAKPTTSQSWNNSDGINRLLESRMNTCVRATPTNTSLGVETGSGVGSIGTNFTNTSTDTTPNSTQQTDGAFKNVGLDEENSSYSSFFSSLLKTDASISIGNTDSGEEAANKLRYSKLHEIYKGDRAADINYSTKTNNETEKKNSNDRSLKTCQVVESGSNLPLRPFKNPQSSWMDSACVTSELINKYQIESQNVDKVLEKDMVSLEYVNQPNMVNEQLSQLYFDLKDDGTQSELTIEEGIITSSSEEDQLKIMQRKRKYSKLVMIYEEDAPLPSPLPADE